MQAPNGTIACWQLLVAFSRTTSNCTSNAPLCWTSINGRGGVLGQMLYRTSELLQSEGPVNCLPLLRAFTETNFQHTACYCVSVPSLWSQTVSKVWMVLKGERHRTAQENCRIKLCLSVKILNCGGILPFELGLYSLQAGLIYSTPYCPVFCIHPPYDRVFNI